MAAKNVDVQPFAGRCGPLAMTADRSFASICGWMLAHSAARFSSLTSIGLVQAGSDGLGQRRVDHVFRHKPHLRHRVRFLPTI